MSSLSDVLDAIYEPEHHEKVAGLPRYLKDFATKVRTFASKDGNSLLTQHLPPRRSGFYSTRGRPEGGVGGQQISNLDAADLIDARAAAQSRGRMAGADRALLNNPKQQNFLDLPDADVHRLLNKGRRRDATGRTSGWSGLNGYSSIPHVDQGFGSAAKNSVREKLGLTLTPARKDMLDAAGGQFGGRPGNPLEREAKRALKAAPKVSYADDVASPSLKARLEAAKLKREPAA